MKIVIISTWDTVGGAALSAWNMRDEFERAGHSVMYLVGFKNSKDKSVYELHHDEILSGIGKILKKNLLATRTFLTSNDVDFGVTDELFDHPWYKQADVIECQNLHGNYINLSSLIRMTREKKVFWALHDEWSIMGHGAWSRNKNPTNGFFRRTDLSSYPPMLWDNFRYLEAKKRLVYTQSDISLIVPSRWLFARVKKSVLASKRTHIIPYGINTQRYRIRDKGAIRARLNIPSDRKIILLVSNAGRHNGQKGWWYLDELLKIMKYDKKILFICVGGNTIDQTLSNSMVRYVPFTDNHDELALYYNAADVFLLPSIYENFPLVTLEALASGLPVVAFNVGGVSEQIAHKVDGYVARYKDVRDLSYGLRFILSSSAKVYSGMVKNARASAIHKYSVKRMVKERLRIYKK